ncbi:MULTISPECIES: DUF4179 domain-containing protein [unclassified Clostridioides]|uniref:DUF4179 domain-containing protein n=1 Tax=unclassified Clostridioides TaxID=2635829 RepID=UPI001D10E730|nr:DUF4179 domain-containing protein [Clostridioides sp. ZZV14-6150]MCC0660544.1 DUF4179 domain-containing protein [Clostridioides sp. ZZV14-6154]MCC0669577.1 DUF4179 domain-containing protein [Clostridioides sp. ZZV14-6153]MCC0718753.1 DUF4179 domain-containing protein [Clostridioides sp. ZZV14-6105]MCC0723404.1 DUF4179 domain-containing protein [Clostridioides sp. ZZV14-6104]MCC0742822.1 DUF4179 domain-containing protein [Clostridioides sp. ZZV14-6044]MCC0751223.1 DUF4179 domain-containing 
MKDKFDLFNETNIDIEKYDDIVLSNEEKDEMKKRMKSKIQYSKKNNFKRYALVGGLSVVILGSTAFTNETTLAYMQHLGKQIEYFFNKDTEELKPYKNIVDDVATDKGIDIKLNEIMLGDGELFLNISVDDSKLDKDALGLKKQGGFLGIDDIKIKVGDMSFVSITGPSTSEKNKDGTTNMVMTCKLDNLDKDGDGKGDVENFDLLKNVDLNKDYDINISINKVEYELNKDIKTSKEIEVGNMGGVEGEHLNGYLSGQWEFNTSINGSNIVKDTKIYNVDKNVKLKNKNIDVDLVLKEVRVSPTKIRVIYGFKTNKYNFNKGDDIPKILEFALKDGRGKDLELLSGAGGYDLSYSKGNYIESSLEYEIKKDVKKLKITPIIEDWSKEINNITEFKKQGIDVDISK